MTDYAIAYQLMKDAFLEGLGQKNRYTEKRLELISKEGKMTTKSIAEMTEVSGASISQWLNPLVSESVLTWCDDHGVKFPDVESLEKAKRSGKTYVMINGTLGLPSPFELTGDERWLEDGELFREYDLELEDVDNQVSLNDPVVEAMTDIAQNQDKIIDFSKMHQTLGFKALSENNGIENKNNGDDGSGFATYSEIFAENLYDEFSGIL